MENVQYYLADVLGVRNVILDDLIEMDMPSYSCVFNISKEFSKEAHDMFLKMTEAMGLKKSEFLLTEMKDKNQDIKSQVVVEFLNEPSDLLGVWHENKIYTLSPLYLMEHPSEKKHVWGHLQQVIKKIT